MSHVRAQLSLDINVDGIGLSLGGAHLDTAIDQIALDVLRQVVRVRVSAAKAQLPGHSDGNRVESHNLCVYGSHYLLNKDVVNNVLPLTRESR